MGFLNKFIGITPNDIKDKKRETQTDINLNNQTAQDFIPFNDIESSMICMDGGKYRMIVEVGSINYDLKTQEERIRIEQQFRMAVSGWDFNFALYTQTREIDNRTILSTLSNDAANISTRYPYLKDYAYKYMEAYAQTTREKEKNLTKRHFVIVNCDDASTIKANKTESDNRDYAFNKLSSAVNKVMSSLSAMQLEVHCLNTMEIAELLFSAINKKEGEIVDGIGDFMSDIVEADVDYETLNRNKLKLLFEGFENQLKIEFFNKHSYTPMEYAKAQRLLTQLDHIKDDIINNETINEDEGYFDLSL